MKALEKYTRKRFKNLHTLLKAFPKENEKETFHKIRLEIKKIKAILGLIHFHDKEFRDHKHYIPFRTIFRITGKLRETGLQQELMEQYTRIHTPFYRSPARGIGKFKKQIPDILKSIQPHEKIILKKITGIRRWLYYTHVQKRKAALTRKLAGVYSAAELHRIRKQIKELVFLINIDKYTPAEPLLNAMAERIGNWHDKILLMEFLSRDSADAEILRELKAETHEDLKELRKFTKEYVRFTRK